MGKGAPGFDATTVAAIPGDLGPLIAGRIAGGTVLVALVYRVVCPRGRPAAGNPLRRG